jgi:hypothetical protein
MEWLDSDELLSAPAGTANASGLMGRVGRQDAVMVQQFTV